MGARRPTVRSVAVLCAITVAVLFMISTGLPWLAEHGYAGRVIQENMRTDRDASALFYTEDERTWAVLEMVSGAEEAAGGVEE